MTQKPLLAWVALAVAVGLGGTVSGTIAARHTEQRTARQQLERRAEVAGSEVSGEIQRYADVAAAIAAGLSAQDELTRADFMEATAPLLKADLAGATGTSFAMAVPEVERAAAQARWRALGATGLTLQPHGTGEHVYLVHGRTLNGIPIPLGNDASASPQLMNAMDEARRGGRIAVTDPYVLITDRNVPLAGQQLSFVVAAPVEDPARGVLRGWLLLGMHASDMLRATLTGPVGDRANAALEVVDRGGRSVLVASRPVGPPAAGMPRRDAAIPVAGRHWTLQLTPTRAAVADDTQAGRFGIAVALGGMLATALISGIVFVLLGARRAALREVRVAEADSRRQAELLGAVLDSISDGVGVIDGRGALLLHNPAARQLFGPSLETGRADWWKQFRFLVADGTGLLPGAELPFSRALRGEAVDRLQVVVRRPEDGEDGEGVTLQVSARPLDRRAGTRGAVAVFQDVTERQRVEEALRAAEERFRFAFDHASTGLSVTDLSETGDGRFLQVNQALCDMVGYPRDELLTMGLHQITHPEDRRLGMDSAAEMHAGVLDTAVVQKRYLRADGRLIWVEITSTMIRDSEGRPLYGVAQTLDVTEQRAEAERLSQAARTDPLTGLGNRQHLRDRMELALARTSRTGRLLGVVFCDLDGFKPVNDLHGHAAGDEVLRVVAARLRESMRPADTLARLGGDEFVVLCEELDGPQDATEVADRIRAVVADPIPLPTGDLVRIGCSTGVVTSAGSGLEVDDLLHRADIAMYDTKRNTYPR